MTGMSFHPDLELSKFAFDVMPTFGLPDVLTSFSPSVACGENLLNVG
jgi:hypothetical protein